MKTTQLCNVQADHFADQTTDQIESEIVWELLDECGEGYPLLHDSDLDTVAVLGAEILYHGCDIRTIEYETLQDLMAGW